MSTTTTNITPANVNAEKIYNLTLELVQVTQQKKSAMGGFNDEIKRIKNEMADILRGAGENIGDEHEVS